MIVYFQAVVFLIASFSYSLLRSESKRGGKWVKCPSISFSTSPSIKPLYYQRRKKFSFSHRLCSIESYRSDENSCGRIRHLFKQLYSPSPADLFSVDFSTVSLKSIFASWVLEIFFTIEITPKWICGHLVVIFIWVDVELLPSLRREAEILNFLHTRQTFALPWKILCRMKLIKLLSRLPTRRETESVRIGESKTLSSGAPKKEKDWRQIRTTSNWNSCPVRGVLILTLTDTQERRRRPKLCRISYVTSSGWTSSSFSSSHNIF